MTSNRQNFNVMGARIQKAFSPFIRKFVSGATINLENSRLSKFLNTAIHISGTVLTENYFSEQGPSLEFIEKLKVSRCVFEMCQTNATGGALYLEDTGQIRSECQIMASFFANNMADVGGGMFIMCQNWSMSDSCFVSNRAREGIAFKCTSLSASEPVLNETSIMGHKYSYAKQMTTSIIGSIIHVHLNNWTNNGHSGMSSGCAYMNGFIGMHVSMNSMTNHCGESVIALKVHMGNGTFEMTNIINMTHYGTEGANIMCESLVYMRSLLLVNCNMPLAKTFGPEGTLIFEKCISNMNISHVIGDVQIQEHVVSADIETYEISGPRLARCANFLSQQAEEEILKKEKPGKNDPVIICAIVLTIILITLFYLTGNGKPLGSKDEAEHFIANRRKSKPAIPMRRATY